MFFVVPLRKVITSKHSTPDVAFCHDVAFLKTGLEPVIYCNPSATFVNSVHDVTKIKPRKFPAVEIRGKNIGNFRSYQKHVSKC